MIRSPEITLAYFISRRYHATSDHEAQRRFAFAFLWAKGYDEHELAISFASRQSVVRTGICMAHDEWGKSLFERLVGLASSGDTLPDPLPRQVYAAPKKKPVATPKPKPKPKPKPRKPAQKKPALKVVKTGIKYT